jgi:hypothetical protein
MSKPLMTDLVHRHIGGKINAIGIYGITWVSHKSEIFRKRNCSRKRLRKAAVRKLHNANLLIEVNRLSPRFKSHEIYQMHKDHESR